MAEAAAISPNQGPRRGGALPDLVVLHYTGMADAAAARARLCDPAAEVSAHWLLDEAGRAERLVPEALRAWHAGAGGWGAVVDVNSRSIGIELANPGHHLGYPPFPAPQMRTLARVLGRILTDWAIPPERVVGHACVAPGRKIDPGEKFDWRALAAEGLAIWLDGPPSGEGPAEPARFEAAARAFGYALRPERERARDPWPEATRAVWRVFRDRFRPADRDPLPSRAALRHLEALAARWPVRDRGA